jgi:hypothetical protein
MLLWSAGPCVPVFPGGALDDFVQFAPVEPDAAAVWAVINFHTIAVGHQKVYIAGWAFHEMVLFEGKQMSWLFSLYVGRISWQ